MLTSRTVFHSNLGDLFDNEGAFDDELKEKLASFSELFRSSNARSEVHGGSYSKGLTQVKQYHTGYLGGPNCVYKYDGPSKSPLLAVVSRRSLESGLL